MDTTLALLVAALTEHVSPHAPLGLDRRAVVAPSLAEPVPEAALAPDGRLRHFELLTEGEIGRAHV